MTNFGPRCMVVLLTEVLLSDWFWCSQPPCYPFSHRSISSARLLSRSVHEYMSLRSCPCLGSLVVAHRFALSLSWQCLWIFALLAGHQALIHFLAAASGLHVWPRLTMALLCSGSLYTPGSMPQVLQGQWCPFPFAGVNFHGWIFLGNWGTSEFSLLTL